ncbi:unnamed protein product [Alopecurus aequalis]
MANFELDPLPWVPWGHQIIDGGPTRLPRTFCNPAQDPPELHLAFCFAMVEPAPPANDMDFWRTQVRVFLTEHLGRNLVSDQPSVFGVGLFEMHSPNSKNALVQHGPFQMQHAGMSVRFISPENAINRRVEHGFYRGWLMFLCVPPDYRNTQDIINAVSTFSKYLSWNLNDPIKSRVLVHAEFPSVTRVPRDVVFNKYSSVGAIRESWTVPLYVLSAVFADDLPADEDPMALDGNPHPLPGGLFHNDNLFVGPQFPEVGWDAVQEPVNVQDQPQANEENADDVNMWEVPVEDQNSMVLHPSDNSGSSVNAAHLHQVNIAGQDGIHQVLNVGMVRTVFGPVPPPSLLWEKALPAILPRLVLEKSPELCFPISMSILLSAKRSWAVAFEDKLIFILGKGVASVNGPRVVTLKPPRRSSGPVFSSSQLVSSDMCFTSPQLVTPSKVAKLRQKKDLLLGGPVRRSARQKEMKDGFRSTPAVEELVPVKKRAKKQSKTKKGEVPEQDPKDRCDNEEKMQMPFTPISVIQNVGIGLGIDPALLTEDQLMAVPDLPSTSGSNDK